MKSRISIALGANNQPVIKIEYSESEDVRDILVKQFLEGFGGDSCWAAFNFYESPTIHKFNGQENTHAILTPISSYDIPELAEELAEKSKFHLEQRKHFEIATTL